MEDRQLLRATLRELGWARLLAATLVLVAGVLLRFADALPAEFPPFVVTVTTAALVWGSRALEELHAFDQSVRLVRLDGAVFSVNGWPFEPVP